MGGGGDEISHIPGVFASGALIVPRDLRSPAEDAQPAAFPTSVKRSAATADRTTSHTMDITDTASYSLEDFRQSKRTGPTGKEFSAFGKLHSVVTDISEGGLQFEIAGLALRRFLDDDAIAVMVEIHFTHPAFRQMKPMVAQITWCRAAGERHTWSAGATFMTRLEPSVVEKILDINAITSRPIPKWPLLVAFASVVCASLLIVRQDRVSRAERDELLQRVTAAEQQADQADAYLKSCEAMQQQHRVITTAPPPAHGAATAAAAAVPPPVAIPPPMPIMPPPPLPTAAAPPPPPPVLAPNGIPAPSGTAPERSAPHMGNAGSEPPAGGSHF